MTTPNHIRISMTKKLIAMTLFAVLSAPAAIADHHKSGHHSKSDKKAARELHEPAAEKAAKKPKTQKHRSNDAASDSRNERATQMQARNTDRKAAKEAYETEVAAGGERVKGKKPWWRIWGD